MAHYLGLDIGTSGTKALLMDASGRVLGTATSEYGVLSPHPGWSEQDPRHWYAACIKATRSVLRKTRIKGREVAGIGLSGQMHGLVITDRTGKPLRPSIIWNDQRTAAEAVEIERKVGGKSKLIQLTGNAAMTSFTLTKLLWVRRHEPRVYDRIRHMLLPKDYVRLRLTGEYVGDVSDMSGTLLLEQRTRQWSRPMISKFQIDADILPPVVESHDITGRLTRKAADEMGLIAGTPVVGGGGDQPAGAVGNGVVRAGLTSAAIGTSGVVFVHSDRYHTDPQSRINTFCSCVAGQWCMFGCILSAGGSFQWLRDTFNDSYDKLTAQAAKSSPGSNGVFFLPYLTGERTPHADPHARGGWFGISATTTRNDLARSVLEGVTFAMNDTLLLLRSHGQRISQIRLSGGGARSAFWRQLQADIYGSTCVTINCEEGPAYGVALLAAVGCGEFDDVPQACRAAIRVTRTIKPDTRRRNVYRKLQQRFDRLYPALKGEFLPA